jgi:hypothetical protein
VSDDLESPKPLTPSHFLIGRTACFQTKVAEAEVVVSQEDLLERELIYQRRLELFWEIWSKDYIRNLPPTVAKFKSKGNVGVGSVVLIREDYVPRMRWPLGLVTRTFPGIDGMVRTLEIRTARGLLTRSIQRVHDLELSSQGQGGGGGSLPSTDQSSERTVDKCSDSDKPRRSVMARGGLWYL